MTAPRHLWSGDWRRESAEAAEELARRRATSHEPADPQRLSPSQPSRPSPWARALAQARSLSVPAAVATAVAVLLAAGAGYAAVFLVRTGEGGSSRSGRASSAWFGVQMMKL